MPNFITQFQIPKFLPRILFMTGLSITIFFNVPMMNKEIRQIRKIQRLLPHRYQIPGYQFAGLEKTLENVHYVGYYTDKDMEQLENAKQFAQAQFMLAPKILVLNSTDYEYTIFDCGSADVALNKIKETGAVALKRNPFGIILARKTQ